MQNIYIYFSFLYPNEVSLFFFLVKKSELSFLLLFFFFSSPKGAKRRRKSTPSLKKSDHPPKTFFFFSACYSRKAAGASLEKKSNRGCFAGEKLVFIINNYIYIYIIYIIKTCFARREERDKI